MSQQLYNAIRKYKNKQFENQIQKLYDYSQTLKNQFDIIWKNDENNKFESLLIVNSTIKICSYSRDIVMIDDTECTNNFNYPFIPFYCFDENNKMEMLAVGILTSKEQKSFCNILESLKLIIDNIRIFIIDRLSSQIAALNKVYPFSFLVYCRVHISRNIENKMGRGNKVINLFWKFINKELTTEEYTNKLQIIINETNSKHLIKLLADIDHYSPYILEKLRLRKHYTTNAIEGSFGNLKKWTDHKILPLHEILKLFVSQGNILMKNHFNCKTNNLDRSIYQGRTLGQYAIQKINRRINKCKELMIQTLNTDTLISEKAKLKLNNCKCNDDISDIPCIHCLYPRIINNSPVLILEEEIPNIYFLQNYDKSDPKINTKITIRKKEKDENWDYNSILDRFCYWADAAQRSEPVREHIRKFF